MSDDRGNMGNVLLAFLVGAAVGGGIALLTAPRSGRETRQKIKDFAGDARDRIREIADDAEERICEVMNNGKQTVVNKRDMIKAGIAAGLEAMAEEKSKHNS